jgi:hypothetical protein
MVIDQNLLDSSVIQYLKSDCGQAHLAEMENSILFNVIGSLIMIPIALLLICTIFLAKIGALMLWGVIQSFLTGEVFRDQRKLLLKNEERIRPLILSTIIIGPDGHGLVLGTFSKTSQQKTDVLSRKAREFADMYAESFPSSTDEEMSEMLKEDSYSPGRRRVVPESHSAGESLILFDMELNLDEAKLSHDGQTQEVSGWVAGVTTFDPEKKVEEQRDGIVQIPWEVVAGAVTDSDLE